VRQRVVLGALAVQWAAVALYALRTSISVGAGTARWVDSLGYLIPPLLAGLVWFLSARGPFRFPWLVFGIAAVGWTGATAAWRLGATGLLSDWFAQNWNVLYLSVYVVALGGIALLVRVLVDESGGEWLDGAIAGLAVAAAGAAIVYKPLLDHAHSTGSAAVSAVYPAGDVVVLAALVAGAALTRAKPLPVWTLLSAAFVTWFVGDVLYVLRVVADTYRIGGLLDSSWSLGFALMASAAAFARTAGDADTARSRTVGLALPGVFGALALAVLIVDHTIRVGTLAVELASASLIALLVRMAYAVRLSARLADSHRQAHTDPVTGLANRRQLMVDLERAAAPEAEPSLLVMADLDEFKRYNDTFGHPAGDLLLARLGGALAEALSASGVAYRIGGDEFCALVSLSREVPRRAIELVVASLQDDGSSFPIGCSHGAVALPAEAHDVATALQLVDDRMYAQKRRRRSTDEQARDLLRQLISEQQPDLEEHVREVSTLARAVATRLAMTADEVAGVESAAELHDIGKVALPEHILRKPGPLDAEEWELMRRHTLVGERILAAAPALRPAAALVRSSHERWDGCGYPDGLVGEDIPLGARIVAVCDAYDAMTTDRPYQRRMTSAAALDELRACSGSQFDPAVVDAFVAEVSESDREISRRRFAPPPPRRADAPLGPVRAVEQIVQALELAGVGAAAERVFSHYAQAIATAFDMQTVVVNVYDPESEQFVVPCVVGDERVRETLTGSVYPKTVWEPVLVERFNRRGAYLLLAGEFDWSQQEGDRYTPEWRPSEDPNAWHPEDELFLPFYDRAGSLVGVFSLGDPSSGRRPHDDELELLAGLASHAGPVYDRVRAAAALPQPAIIAA
jgi:diguanylate cyclase (GGDEF)-like protein